MTGAEDMMVAREKEAEKASLRLCAVTRAQKPPEDLIRFVLGPDGVVVPDLARRLPGRGVWVSATREAVAEAVRGRAFARSLKQNVSVPPDLALQIEGLMAKRLAEAVSLANKAGLLVSGFTKVEGLIEEGRAAVLLHAADAAEDGVAKLDRKFKALRGPEVAPHLIVRALSSAELSLAIGRPNVIHAASSEGGASQRILQEARRLRRYRANAGENACAAPALDRTQDVHVRDEAN